jgi:hypothetical protein
MRNINVTGLSKAELTAAGVSRPQTSLNDIKLEARHTGCPIVIEHATGRWIVVMPGGAVLGTGGEAKGAFWAEHTAWEMDNGNDYQVILDRVVGL